MELVNGLIYIITIIIIIYVINYNYINNHIASVIDRIKLIFSYIINSIFA